MASSAFTAVGLDLGSQKTMIVADDGEIIRTSTGTDGPADFNFANIEVN